MVCNYKSNSNAWILSESLLSYQRAFDAEMEVSAQIVLVYVHTLMMPHA
jgi:hypothetical protein